MDWICVSTKKPPVGQRVLVSLGGQVWEARYEGCGKWCRYNGYDMQWWMNRGVTAWCVLPPAYEETPLGVGV